LGYFDPSAWVNDTSDGLIPECEIKIMHRKKAIQTKSSSSGKSFIPWLSIEWEITIVDTGSLLRLTMWRDRQNKVDINLQESARFLRKGHFNYPSNQGHVNPDNQVVDSKNHIHFPTIKFPSLDLERKKYCYATNAFNSYLEYVILFCDHTNIMARVSLPLVS